MAVIANLFQGTMFINYKNSGNSERFYLKANSYDTAEEIMKKLVPYRMSFCGLGVQCVWARVNIVGRPWEARGIAKLPMSNIWIKNQQVEGVPDNPNTSLLFRMETKIGLDNPVVKWANRMFRFVSDALVEDYATNPNHLIPLGAAELLSPIDDPESDMKRVRRSFLRFMLDNTIHAIKNPANPPGGFITTEWDRFIYRRVSNRKTGRPFGMSAGRARAA